MPPRPCAPAIPPSWARPPSSWCGDARRSSGDRHRAAIPGVLYFVAVASCALELTAGLPFSSALTAEAVPALPRQPCSPARRARVVPRLGGTAERAASGRSCRVSAAGWLRTAHRAHADLACWCPARGRHAVGAACATVGSCGRGVDPSRPQAGHRYRGAGQGSSADLPAHHGRGRSSRHRPPTSATYIIRPHGAPALTHLGLPALAAPCSSSTSDPGRPHAAHRDSTTRRRSIAGIDVGARRDVHLLALSGLSSFQLRPYDPCCLLRAPCSPCAAHGGGDAGIHAGGGPHRYVLAPRLLGSGPSARRRFLLIFPGASRISSRRMFVSASSPSWAA